VLVGLLELRVLPVLMVFKEEIQLFTPLRLMVAGVVVLGITQLLVLRGLLVVRAAALAHQLAVLQFREVLEFLDKVILVVQVQETETFKAVAVAVEQVGRVEMAQVRVLAVMVVLAIHLQLQAHLQCMLAAGVAGGLLTLIMERAVLAALVVAVQGTVLLLGRVLLELQTLVAVLAVLPIHRGVVEIKLALLVVQA